MKVHFEKPQKGCFLLSIDHENSSYSDYIDNFPWDFFHDLLAMLTRIWNGDPNVCIMYLIGSPYGLVQWLDSAKFRVGVSHQGDPIPCSTDNKTLIEFNITAKDLCVAFWRGLRDLEGKTSPEEWTEHWGGEFPSDSLQILTNLIKEEKDNS